MTYTRDMNAMQGHVSPDTPVQGNPTRIWAAQVVTVNPDGTIDVQPMQSRATKNGVAAPNWYAPAVGDEVLVCDLNGDPRTPTVIAPVGALAGIPTIKAQTLGAAGGDLSGNYPNPTVVTIGGHTPITNATAAGGDLLGTFPSPTVNWGDSGHLAWAAPSKCYRNAAYTTAAAAFNPGYWDTVSYDPGGNLFLSGGIYTYKVPATGYYSIATAFESAAATGRSVATLMLATSGGSFTSEIARGGDTTTAGSVIGVAAASIELLTVGSYVSGAVYTTNGVAMAIGPVNMYFAIVRVA